MLASIAHCTIRSVLRAIVMEGYFSPNRGRIAAILRRNPSEENFFLCLNDDVGLIAPAASVEISGTRRDARHRPHRAPQAWNKTSHPRPAPVATRDRGSSRARRRTCIRRCRRKDEPPTGGTNLLYV